MGLNKYSSFEDIANNEAQDASKKEAQDASKKVEESITEANTAEEVKADNT